MLTENEMLEKLKNSLSYERFVHSLGVRDTAVKLAKNYGADSNKASVAGLLHDCAKDMPSEKALLICQKYNLNLDEIAKKNEGLFHGPVGAMVAQIEYEVVDREILDAIYYHTLTRENMTLLEKVICVADFIEPSRKFKIVEKIRAISYDNIDKALIEIFKATINYVVLKKEVLHPAKLKTLESLQKSINL